MRGKVVGFQMHYMVPTQRYSGTIETENGTRYYFHWRQVRGGIMSLDEGNEVEFEEGTYEGRIQALNVRKLEEQVKVPVSVPHETYPGISRNINLDRFDQEKRIIIETFGRLLYVTHGGDPFYDGNSSYDYFLIKPTAFFTRKYHLVREIVVILVPYDHFEARTLQAVNRVYSSFQETGRLDRGCQVIITHVEDTASMEPVLRDNRVNRIVIPFTYQEFLNGNMGDEKIHERFSQYLFEGDLFAETAPIEDELFFFGRSSLVNDLVGKCKEGINCGVFGLRRSGKTSVLYAIKSKLMCDDYPQVYIPCGRLSNLDWKSALYDLYRSVSEARGLVCLMPELFRIVTKVMMLPLPLRRI